MKKYMIIILMVGTIYIIWFISNQKYQSPKELQETITRLEKQVTDQEDQIDKLTRNIEELTGNLRRLQKDYTQIVSS